MFNTQHSSSVSHVPKVVIRNSGSEITISGNLNFNNSTQFENFERMIEFHTGNDHFHFSTSPIPDSDCDSDSNCSTDLNEEMSDAESDEVVERVSVDTSPEDKLRNQFFLDPIVMMRTFRDPLEPKTFNSAHHVKDSYCFSNWEGDNWETRKALFALDCINCDRFVDKTELCWAHKDCGHVIHLGCFRQHRMHPKMDCSYH